MRPFIRAIVSVTWMLCACTPAFAQGSVSSSISGTVVDTDNGVIPGATVEVRNTATNAVLTTVTNTAGVFSVPSIDPGVYAVTVSLEGFKSYVVGALRVTLGAPVDIKATLQPGGVSETVEVNGGEAELINTQTATVSATLLGDEIAKLPTTSRNLVNAVSFLPGVNSADGVVRDSTFNGLPGEFVAINLDGINDNENLSRDTEGFFATLSPRQDAIQAVTVTTAAAGADIGSQGAVQVDFVTRSGSNRFDGSAYEYFRNAAINSNTWFNINAGLPKNQVTLNQFGFRQGGPIKRNKAFFFVNLEESDTPQNTTRTRTLYSPATADGIFQYNVTSGGTTTVRQVNLLALAQANGFGAAVDPTVEGVLQKIQAATATGGLITQQADPNLQNYVWQSAGVSLDREAVGRLDYDASEHNQITGTFSFQIATRNPDLQNNGDPRFPGGLNYSEYVARRPEFTLALRSTITPNLVNDLHGGGRWSPSYFGQGSSVAASTFEDTAGYSLSLGDGATGWTTTNSPSFRNAANSQFDDTLTWLHGKQTITTGGELYFGTISLMNSQTVPAITFGVASNDPASALFTTANFPGASSAQLSAAEAIFATLTGRVTGVSGLLTLDPSGQYVYNTPRYIRGRLNVYSTFAQDSWRATPTLTLTGGLRYQVQTPWSPSDSTLSQATFLDACGISGTAANGTCNFFQPGASGGVTPEFTQFVQGTTAYHTDWNNLAPNASAAWRPNVQHGWLRALLGDPDQATLRAGYSVQYDREGMDVFTGVYGNNPGSQVTVSATATNGLLAPPVYLTNTAALTLASPCGAVATAACNPGSPTYPIAVRPNAADSLSVFDPNIQISYARNYTVGFERPLSKTTALEVRYVGTRGLDLWGREAYNTLDLTNSGFLNEFQTAMNNLRADVLAGCGGAKQPACTFAYRGPGTGTSPLPIYLAYFDGSKNATNPAAYTGSNWTNSTYVGYLAYLNPSLNAAANALQSNVTFRQNALNAGLPANFFVLNPAVSGVTVETSNGSSIYNSLQIEIRHRLSRGFQIEGSYDYGLESDSTFLGPTYGYALDPVASLRHAFKFQWDYEIPFGRGLSSGGGRILADVLGGWSFNGVARVQASMLNFGSVRLVNMTPKQLQQMFHVRIGPDPSNPGQQIVTMLPSDVILNTERAFNTSATTVSGYSAALGAPDPDGQYIAPAESANCITVVAGDCAPRSLLIRAPFFTRVDVSLSKRLASHGHSDVELSVNIYNLFNNINFNYVANPGTSPTIFQVTSAFSDLSNTQDPGGRLGELVARFNW